jgi:hypothetical protein
MQGITICPVGDEKFILEPVVKTDEDAKKCLLKFALRLGKAGIKVRIVAEDDRLLNSQKLQCVVVAF